MFAHVILGLLVQRWVASCPAPALGFSTGPDTVHVPQGRLEPVQLLRPIVVCPLLMIGERCEMPVQPVSRMLFGDVGSPLNVTVDGHAHWHVGLHVNAALVLDAF